MATVTLVTTPIFVSFDQVVRFDGCLSTTPLPVTSAVQQGSILGPTILMFNSHTAITGAIIGLLLVFYNSKKLNCVGALCFFTTRRGVLRFYRFLRFEEEYWDSTGFFTTRRRVLRFYRFLQLEEEYWVSQIFFSRKQVCSWLEFWLLSVRAFTSVFDRWLLFSKIGL